MERGWVDYILPQLYFNIGYENADFKILAGWWQDNAAGTPLYAGLATYKLDRNSKIPAWRETAEIKRQTWMIRESKGYQGVCYFNAKDFKTNKLGINKLVSELYKNPALVPPLRGFEKEPPAQPVNAEITLSGNKILFCWSCDKEEFSSVSPFYHAIYKFKKGDVADFNRGESLIYLTGEEQAILTCEKPQDYDYYITSLDRLYNESKPVKFKIIK